MHYRVKREKGFVDKEKLSLAYPVGEKILISHLEFQVGGGGTNTAVAFSRLGLKTGYLGKIGVDDNGKRIFGLLKKEKVGFMGSRGGISGYSVVLDSLHEDRTILAFKGCNDDLSYSEISLGSLNAKWFYFSSMMGESLNTLKKLARFASRKKVKIAFNPSNYLAEKGVEEIKPVLDACNILILNKEEAGLLSGMNSIDESFLFLKRHPCEYVVITDGSKGAYCYDGKKVYHGKPLPGLKIVETTGAGDAFASGFMAFIVMGEGVVPALRAGLLQAESVIQSYGAKNDLYTKKKLLSKVARDTRKIGSYDLSRDCAPPGKWFVLCNGEKVRSLNSLAGLLGGMPDTIFLHHVNVQRNDFALWVEHVFHEKSLAEKISLVKSKWELAGIIKKHLKKRGSKGGGLND